MFDTTGDTSPGRDPEQFRNLLDKVGLNNLTRASRLLDMDRSALSRFLNGHRKFSLLNELVVNMVAKAVNDGAHPGFIKQALSDNLSDDGLVSLMVTLVEGEDQ
jgi:hypothetical protein|tara:strand:+ start:17048 stop:17359 length:312 start_codon:yes stop_codon:yes gene_type:complete